MYSLEYLSHAVKERSRLLEDSYYKSKISHSDKELQLNATNLYTHYLKDMTTPLPEKEKKKIEQTFKLNNVQTKKLQYLFDSAYSDEYILLWLAKELSENIYIDPSISNKMRENMLRQWFRKLSIIGQGEEGVTLLTKHAGLDVDFVMKTFHKKRGYNNLKLQEQKQNGRKSMIHEFVVGLYGLNKLRTEYHIPNFAYVFGMFDCGFSKDLTNIRQCFCVAMKSADNKRVIPNRFIIYENINNTKSSPDFGTFLEKDTIKNIFNYYLQCVFACYSAYKISGFTHYDLHIDNVMIRSLPTNYSTSKSKILPTIHYPYPDIFLEVENVATIIDYEYSHISVNVSDLEEFDHSVKDSVPVPYNKNDKTLLGVDKMVVEKKIPIGVASEIAFSVGISGRKPNPMYDFFKLLLSILFSLFNYNRITEAKMFEPLFRFFNSTDPFTKEVIMKYNESFGGLIEQENFPLNLDPQEYLNRCMDIATSKFPGMVHKKYNNSLSFDCSSPKNLCLKKYDSKFSRKNPLQTVDIYNQSLVSIYYNELKSENKYDEDVITRAIKEYINDLKINMDDLAETFMYIKKLFELMIKTVYDNITHNKKKRGIGQRSLNIYNVLSEFLTNIDKFYYDSVVDMLELISRYYDRVNAFITQFRALEADIEFLEKAYAKFYPKESKNFIRDIDNILNKYYNDFLKIYIKRKTSLEFLEKILSVDSSITKSMGEVKSSRRYKKSKPINNYMSERNSNDLSNLGAYFTNFIKADVNNASKWQNFASLCKYYFADYSSVIP